MGSILPSSINHFKASHIHLSAEEKAAIEDLVANGSSGGAVDSVNGQVGVVVLTASDLGAQPSDATLLALAGVSTSADTFIYSTGVDTFSTTTLTAFARTFLSDISALSDPGADRIFFWDDSAGVTTWLEVGSGLSVTGTILSVSGGVGLGDVVGPITATDNAVVRYNGATGESIQDSGIIIDDSDNISGLSTITIPNTGLHILDTNSSHDLIFTPGSDLSADRSLTFITGDSSRTITLTGDTSLTGTNTGDQTIILTSDVTGSGTGSFATTIASNAVSDAKLRDSGALSVIGRSANSSGDPADISASAASGAVLRESGSVLGFGTISTAGIADDAVTFAKIEDIATNTILGRITALSGNTEELTGTQATTLLVDFVGDAGSGGTKGLVPAPTTGDATKYLKGDGTWAALAGGGDVSGPGSSTDNAIVRFDGIGGVTIQNSLVIIDDTDNVTGMTTLTLPNTGLHILDINASHDLIVAAGSDLTADRTLTITTGDSDRMLTISSSTTLGGGSHSGTNTGDQTITLTSDVTGSGVGSFATTIAADAVSDTKLRDSGALSVIGRSANSTGDPADISTTATSGAVLRESGSTIGFGTIATTGITDAAVTLAKIQNIDTSRILGRITALSGATEELTGTQATTLLVGFVGDAGSGGTKGLVPAPTTGDATKYLKGDGTWATVSGSGDVVGPASATDNAIVRFDLTTGKLIQDSGIIIDDSNNVTGVATITIANTGLHILDTNASHDLIVVPGSNLTADRTLTLITGDADKTLTVASDTTLGGGSHSGTNTGDQTITLTTDVTGTGTGSFATTIAAGAVTYAKMQDVSAESKLIGRGQGSGSGDPQEITIGSGLTMTGTTLTASGGSGISFAQAMIISSLGI